MSPVSKKDNLRQFFYADHDLRVRDVGAAVSNISGEEEPAKVDQDGEKKDDDDKKAPPVSPRSNKLTQFDREFIAKWKEHKEMGHFR